MSEIIKEVLKLEAQGILNSIDEASLSLPKAAELILACKGKVIVSGVGKSGLIGAKIAATLASTGTPSFFLHPTEALHGDLGMLQKDDLVLAISFSGESEELKALLPHLERFGTKIIAMSKNKNSSLGQAASVFISLNIEKEACPLGAAPTVSTTLTLALGDALAVYLMQKREFKKEDFASFHPGGSLGKRLFLKVKQVMKTESLPIIRDNVNLKIAIDEMTHGKFGTVLLVDEEGKLKAILSDGDLRRALMSENFSLEDEAIKYASKKPKVLKDENILAAQALKMIEAYKIQLLVVVDEENKPRGILHIHDLTALGL